MHFSAHIFQTIWASHMPASPHHRPVTIWATVIRQMADRQMADRQMADCHMADRQMADRQG